VLAGDVRYFAMNLRRACDVHGLGAPPGFDSRHEHCGDGGKTHGDAREVE
jgi:hypothetical protein